MAFTLPLLPYAYDALEPYYDAQTVEIHHAKHHKTYTDKLNAALESAGIQDNDIESILKNLNAVAEDKRGPVRNHGGATGTISFFGNRCLLILKVKRVNRWDVLSLLLGKNLDPLRLSKKPLAQRR